MCYEIYITRPFALWLTLWNLSIVQNQSNYHRSNPLYLFPETVDVRPISYYHYIPDFIPVRRRAMDNLEYHMMNNETSANINQQLPPFQRLPSMSNEEETDYVSTKRELLPLTHHRSETTV